MTDLEAICISPAASDAVGYGLGSIGSIGSNGGGIVQCIIQVRIPSVNICTDLL